MSILISALATTACLAAGAAIVAATTAAVTITATATVAAATAAAKAAFFPWAGHVDLQWTIGHGIAVEGLDGLLGFTLVAHFHKREALGLPRVAVFDQSHRCDRPCLCKERAQIVFGGIVGQVAYINLGCHLFFLSF
jgi:hypothetical protein